MNAIANLYHIQRLEQIQEEQKLFEMASIFEYQKISDSVKGVPLTESIENTKDNVVKFTKSIGNFIITQIEKMVTFIKKTVNILRAKVKQMLAGHTKKLRDKVSTLLKNNNISFSYSGNGINLDKDKYNEHCYRSLNGTIEILNIINNATKFKGSELEDWVTYDQSGMDKFVISRLYGDKYNSLEDTKKMYEDLNFVKYNNIEFTNDMLRNYISMFDDFYNKLDVLVKNQYTTIDKLNKTKAILKKKINDINNSDDSLSKYLNGCKSMVISMNKIFSYELSVYMNIYTASINICNSIFKKALDAKGVTEDNDTHEEVKDDINISIN